METITTRKWVAATLAGAALAAGCGGETRTKTVTVPADEAGKPVATATATSTPAGSAADPAPVGGLASGEATIDDGLTRLTVTELRRSGPTVVLNARLEPAGPDTESSRQVTDSVSDGREPELTSGEFQEHDTFDGPYLVDPAGRKKYLVALDAEGNCVCTNGLSDTHIEDGPVTLQATLSAPPPAVKQVDLTIPRFGTFRGVPISE